MPQGGVPGSADPNCATFNGGATTGQIKFRTVILQDYTDDYPSGDSSVDEGDRLERRRRIDGEVLDVNTLDLDESV